jgi:hypothetical protein
MRSLQNIKGGPSGFVESDNFAVDHGFLWWLCEAIHYLRISTLQPLSFNFSGASTLFIREVFVIARAEIEFPAGDLSFRLTVQLCIETCACLESRQRLTPLIGPSVH